MWSVPNSYIAKTAFTRLKWQKGRDELLPLLQQFSTQPNRTRQNKTTREKKKAMKREQQHIERDDAVIIIITPAPRTNECTQCT